MTTRVPSADSHENRREGGRHGRVSLQTLFIASAASAAAAYAIAQIWGPGTLIGAAAAPVIVALVSEFLRRPVGTVSATAKRLPVVRMTPTGASRSIAAAGDSTGGQPEPAPESEAEPVASGPPGPPAPSEPFSHSDSSPSRWPWAVLTGLVAFTTVVAAFTVPDLLAGRSITGNGQPTTFFGGSSKPGGATRRLTTTVTTPAPVTVTVTTPAAATTAPTATTAPATTTATQTPTTATAPTTTTATQTPTTATAPTTTPSAP